MGLDGTGVPMRASELVGRSGKQPDGSSKSREVKRVTIWSAEGRDPEGIPVRDEGSVTYSAAIESAASRDTDKELSEFAQRVSREAARRRFEQAPRRVILGDGAPWIWNLATELFPRAIQIVDRYHADEHLAGVAKAVYGPGTDLAQQWTHERCSELKAGKIDAVLAALGAHFSVKEARECHRGTSRPIAGACAMTNSTPPGCVPPPRLSNLAAKGSSGCVLSKEACSGRWPVPTPSSPFAAAVSAAASRTSGSAEHSAQPADRATSQLS